MSSKQIKIRGCEKFKLRNRAIELILYAIGQIVQRVCKNKILHVCKTNVKNSTHLRFSQTDGQCFTDALTFKHLKREHSFLTNYILGLIGVFGH